MCPLDKNLKKGKKGLLRAKKDKKENKMEKENKKMSKYNFIVIPRQYAKHNKIMAAIAIMFNREREKVK